MVFCCFRILVRRSFLAMGSPAPGIIGTTVATAVAKVLPHVSVDREAFTDARQRLHCAADALGCRVYLGAAQRPPPPRQGLRQPQPQCLGLPPLASIRLMLRSFAIQFELRELDRHVPRTNRRPPKLSRRTPWTRRATVIHNANLSNGVIFSLLVQRPRWSPMPHDLCKRWGVVLVSWMRSCSWLWTPSLFLLHGDPSLSQKLS